MIKNVWFFADMTCLSLNIIRIIRVEYSATMLIGVSVFRSLFRQTHTRRPQALTDWTLQSETTRKITDDDGLTSN